MNPFRKLIISLLIEIAFVNITCSEPTQVSSADTECFIEEEKDEALLIISLKNHFSSGCLFLLHSSPLDFRMEHRLTHLRRLLSYESTSSSVINLDNFIRNPSDMWCSFNMPFYVVSHGNAATKSIFQMPNSRETLTKAFTLVFLKEEEEDGLTIDDNSLPLDTEFIVARRRHSSWELFEMWHEGHGSPIREMYYGSWLCGKPTSEWPGLELWNRRGNLHGLRLSAAAVQNYATILMEDDGEIRLSGPIGNLWNSVMRQLNITTQVIKSEDGVCGSENADGWSGMVGDVASGKVHLALSFFTMSEGRSSVVDFTSPLLLGRYYIFIRKVSLAEDDVEWEKLLTPFSSKLWLATLMTIGILVCGMAVIYYSYKHNSDNSLFFVLTAFLLQGAPRRVKISEFCIGQLAYYTAFILFSAYSAKLISVLAVYRPRTPFRTLEEFSNEGSYKLVVTQQTAEQDFFKFSIDPLLQQIYHQQMKPHDFPLNELEGLSRVCTENKYAFLTTDILIQYAWHHQNCSITAIPIDMFHCTVALVFKKNSPYLGVTNYYLQALRGGGLLKRTLQSSLLYFQTSEQISNTVISVAIQDIIPSLSLLATSIICSILVFIIECLSVIISKHIFLFKLRK